MKNELLVIVMVVIAIGILIYIFRQEKPENFELLNGLYDNAILTNDTGQFSYMHFPKGAIVIWYGNINGRMMPVPDGWALCDGTNGTPDLRGKIPLGSQGNNLNQVGGAETVAITLQTANLPPHKHTYWTGTTAGVQESSGICSADVTGPGLEWTQESSSVGANAPFNIFTVPPVLTLAYIMKIK